MSPAPTCTHRGALTLHGAIDGAAFTRAWSVALHQHDVLRSSFVWDGLPEPLHAVHPRVDPIFDLVDLSAAPEDERGRRLESLLQEDFARPFTLASAPLLRGKLVRVDDRRHELVWTWHHLTGDGWSTPLWLETLFTAYRRELGAAVALPARGRFGDFIAALQEQKPELKAHATSGWRSWARSKRRPDSPWRMRRRRSAASARRSRLEARGRRAGGRAVHPGHGITASTLAHAAWALTLSRYSGEREVLFGSVASGRSALTDVVDQERTGGCS